MSGHEVMVLSVILSVIAIGVFVVGYVVGATMEARGWRLRARKENRTAMTSAGAFYYVVPAREHVESLEELNRLRSLKRVVKFPDETTIDDLVGELQQRSMVGVVALSVPDDGNTSSTHTIGWGYRPGQLGLVSLLRRETVRKFVPHE